MESAIAILATPTLIALSAHAPLIAPAMVFVLMGPAAARQSGQEEIAVCEHAQATATTTVFVKMEFACARPAIPVLNARLVCAPTIALEMECAHST